METIILKVIFILRFSFYLILEDKMTLPSSIIYVYHSFHPRRSPCTVFVGFLTQWFMGSGQSKEKGARYLFLLITQTESSLRSFDKFIWAYDIFSFSNMNVKVSFTVQLIDWLKMSLYSESEKIQKVKLFDLNRKTTLPESILYIKN